MHPLNVFHNPTRFGICLVVFVVFLLSGCGGGGGGGTSQPAVTLQSIAVTPANPAIPKGLTNQFTATGTYSDGTSQNLTATVTWSSGTTSVATVVASGLSSGAGVGSSVITATSGSVSGNTTLTVTAATLQSIAVTPANPAIPKGLTNQFTATGTYSDGTSQDITSAVTWSSGTTSVATVVASGLASGAGVGPSVITATSGSVSGNTTLTVTAATLQSIAVTPANPTTSVGLTNQFTATGTYSDGTSQDITSAVTWSSGTTSVATVIAGGLASGVGVGSSVITATSGSVSGNTTLTVMAAAAAKLVFAQQPSNIIAGATMSPPVTVLVQDSFGNTNTSSSATVTLSSSLGGLVGTSTVSASSGVATFSGLTLLTSGTYTLAATSAGLVSTISIPFMAAPAAAAKLAFTTQPPTSVTAGAGFGTTVTVQDSFGNTITSSSATVTLTSSSDGFATFSSIGGTSTVSASSGVATFSGLVMSTAGTYMLAASTGGLQVPHSNSFTVSPAASTSLGDVAVNVASNTLYKLNAADGTIIWGPVSRPNCGGIAVDQVDFGVYTGQTAHCLTGAGSGVYKFDASGTQAWNFTGYAACGSGGAYYIGNGGIAVDRASANPGIVLTMGGLFGNLGKINLTGTGTLWCNATNDIGRPTIDPANGQIYAITNAGAAYNYNTIYSDTTAGGQTAAASCEGYTDLNPADGMLYRGGGMAANGCGLTLYQMNKSILGGVNWSMNLTGLIPSFDAVADQPWVGGLIYVASVSAQAIVVIDPVAHAVVRVFTTAIPPNFIAVNPVGGNVYVASSASGFVYAYSPTGALVWISPNMGAAVSSIAVARGIVGGP